MRSDVIVVATPSATDLRHRLRKMSRPLILVVAAFALLGNPSQKSHAQLAPQWNYCTGSSDIDWDTQIRNCTTLLQSSRETRKNRSIAYINRGLAYYTLKNFDRAIGDYTEAINLDPQSVIAFHNRDSGDWPPRTSTSSMAPSSFSSHSIFS